MIHNQKSYHEGSFEQSTEFTFNLVRWTCVRLTEHLFLTLYFCISKKKGCFSFKTEILKGARLSVIKWAFYNKSPKSPRNRSVCEGNKEYKSASLEGGIFMYLLLWRNQLWWITDVLGWHGLWRRSVQIGFMPKVFLQRSS